MTFDDLWLPYLPRVVCLLARCGTGVPPHAGNCSYGCDCTGCDCVADGPCPPTCFEATCDEWIENYPTTQCTYLEDTYGCDCDECGCNSATTAVETSAFTTPKPMCPETCFDNTCEVMQKDTGSTFAELQARGCDCYGCVEITTTTSSTTSEEYTGIPLSTTTAPCPANCYNFNCDQLIGYGYNCDELESVYSCNCNGCACTTTTTSTSSTSSSTTTSTTTTTNLNACGLRIVSDYYDTGNSEVDVCVDFNVDTDADGCVDCGTVEVATGEVVQLHFEDTTALETLYVTTDVAVFNDCDLDNADESVDVDGLDRYNFASDDDGVYYVMSGVVEFGIINWCETWEHKMRIIVGDVADGCMNETACNYNESNVVDTQDACEFPPPGATCNFTCKVAYDECGVCNGDGEGESVDGVVALLVNASHPLASTDPQEVVGGCFKKSWVDDGACDDGNNNCMCGWDGGDCCGVSNTYSFCAECACLDPSFVAPAPDYCGRACWRSKFTSDGFCDDANNHCGCDWDGGDCCGESNNYNFCNDEYTNAAGVMIGCSCQDPDFVAPAPAPSDGCVLRCGGSCAKPAFAGDGICDDSNNVCGCDWDAGDCCGIGNSYQFCDDAYENANGEVVGCSCLDCNYEDPEDECGHALANACFKSAWAGDGACDDANNHAGCDWDGGDCCGTSNSYAFCTDCECLDCTYEWPSDACIDKIQGVCGKANFVGDGFCDDKNNNAGCSWDDGDCCGAENNYDYCSDCECLNCTYPILSDNCTAEIVGTCGAPKFQGDGFCDDSNNIAGCDWDLGDCCDPEADMTYCTACECLDCDYVFNGDDCVSAITGSCGSPNYKGDGFCDDINNVAGCDWDDGDCCGTSVATDYCNDCECLDCTFSLAVGDCVDYVASDCAKPKFVGDGYCDDDNNNAGCDWDNGDCCGASNIYQYCDDCACLDCQYEAQGDDCVDEFTKVCKNSKFQGDGFCDDGNNNGGCDWDGGDCCGAAVKTNYCSDCECLDCTFVQEYCSGVCQKSNFYADKFCDDGNNNCGCDWDGGGELRVCWNFVPTVS